MASSLAGMADALGDTPDAVRYGAEAEKLFAALGVPA